MVLEVASAYGFALVPVGMLCSQYLFFLGQAHVLPCSAALAGALTATWPPPHWCRGGADPSERGACWPGPASTP